MPTKLRNFLAVIAGMLTGVFVNSGILELWQLYVPPPAGFSSKGISEMASTMYLLSLKDFIGPLLAHAMGTFVGAVLAARIGRGHPLRMTLPIAFLFFCAGAYMVYELPSPLWFNITDLTLAYFPMAILATRLFRGKKY
ncbi:MAG: hypothetical protein ACKOQY_11455 [Bacteroidota bacterium]